MGQLENWFQDSLISVEESRQELGGVPVRRSAHQPEVVQEKTDGQGWQANSA